MSVGAVQSRCSRNPSKLYPIAFHSQKVTSTERNYGIGDRERLVVKLALEEWRHWLEGANHPFLVLTGYKNLEYLRTAKRLTQDRTAGLCSFLSSALIFCTVLTPTTPKLMLYLDFTTASLR